MKAHAWAILNRGEIDVKTVSPTARAAIVNWLVVERGQLITRSMGDLEIRKLWDEQQRGARCVPVTVILTVSRVQDDPASAFGA